MLNRGETLKLRELERGFQNPQTISLAYYQASLLVEHIVSDLRRRRAAQAGARVRQGHRHRRGAEGRAEHRLRRSCRPASTRRSSRRSARCARRWRRPTDAEICCEMPLDDAARRCAAEQPGQLPGADGARPRAAQGRRARRGDAGVRARRGARADRRPAHDSPHAQIAAIALEKKDQPRAIAALTALDRGRLRQRRGGPAARGAAARGRASTIRAEAAAGLQRIVAIDPFDAEAHADARPAGAAAQRRRTPRRASSAPCSRSGRSIGRRPTPISPRATSRAASAPRRRSRRWPRSRSRRATSARRTCC